MRRQAEMLARAGFVTVCIYRSTPEHVSQFAGKHVSARSLALSDRKGTVYDAFSVKRSTAAVLIRSWDKTLKDFSNMKQFWNLRDIAADTRKPGNGSHNQLPADFLIDENGLIADVFRAQKAHQSMPFERIEAFIPDNKRCRCNKKDCISPRCRQQHEAIMKQAESSIFMG